MEEFELQEVRAGLRSESLDEVRQAYAMLLDNAPRLIKRLADGLYWDDGGYICGFPDGRVEGIDVCYAPFGLWVAWSLLRDSGVLAEQTEIKLHGLREVVFLKGLEQLKTLDLKSVEVDSFAFLTSLPSVRRLKLAGSRLEPDALGDPALKQIKHIVIEGCKPEALSALASNPRISLDVFQVVSLFPISSQSDVRLVWPKTSLLRIMCPLKPKLGEANYARVRAVELDKPADAAFCEALGSNRTVRCLRLVTFSQMPSRGAGKALQCEGLSHIDKVLKLNLIRGFGRLTRKRWGYDPDNMQWFSAARQRRERPDKGLVKKMRAMNDALLALCEDDEILGFDRVDLKAIFCPGMLRLLQVMRPGCLRELHLVDVWEGEDGSEFSEYFAPRAKDPLASITVGNNIVFNPDPLWCLAKSLAEAPGLRGVRTLKLENFVFRDDSFDVFCTLAPLETIETLSLRANALKAEADAVFAKHADKLPRLRALDLGGSCGHRPGHVGNEVFDVSAIAASPLARQLEHLDLSDIEITSDACRTIYDSEVFPRLRWLRPKISEYRAEFDQRHETTDWVTALQQVFDQHPRAVINLVWRLKAEEYGRPRDTDVAWRHSVGPEEMTILGKRDTVTVWVMVRWTERQIVVYYFDAHACSTGHYILPLTEDQLYLLRRATWPRSRPMPDVQEDLHGLNPLCDYFPWAWS